MTANPTLFELAPQHTSARTAVVEALAKVQRRPAAEIANTMTSVPSADVAAIVVQVERVLGCAEFPSDAFDAPNAHGHPALCYDATDTFRLGRLVQIVEAHLASTGWRGNQ